MSTPIDIALKILQGLWGFWLLILLAAFEGAQGWRIRKKEDNLKLLKRILRNLLLGWLFFVLLWIVLALVKRPPSSYIIPETLNYSLFWMFGVGLIGLEALLFIVDRAQIAGPLSDATGLKDLLALTADEFEQLVAETYQAFGYRVQSVTAPGAYGIDLILHSSRGEKSVVQCKRWEGNVGDPVVRDFFEAMQREGVVEGAIITTGTFTQQAREWAIDKPIHLYDGEQFLRVLYRAQSMAKTEPLEE